MKGLLVFVGPAGVVVDLLNIASPQKGPPVSDACALDGGLVAACLGDCPGGT